MGKTQAQPNYPKGTDFEQVWTILQETAKRHEEIAKQHEEIVEQQKEIDRIVKANAEQQKETDRLIKELRESQKETARQMKETDRKMQETAESQKETARQMKETDRKMQETAESQKETARQMKETDRKMQETTESQKETDRQMKEYNKRLGEFTNRFGEVVEYMVAPNLREKFREMGLNFPKANPNVDVSDYDNQIFLEIDVLLENGDKAMLVEIKTKLTTERVKEHIKRLEKMRVYADLHGDKRRFLGAVAGVVMTPHVKKYALEQGLYVVEPSGETFSITKPNGDPKEW